MARRKRLCILLFETSLSNLVLFITNVFKMICLERRPVVMCTENYLQKPKKKKSQKQKKGNNKKQKKIKTHLMCRDNGKTTVSNISI